jgi:hypothetical protein
MHFNDAGAEAVADLLAPVFIADKDLQQLYRANQTSSRSMPTHILDRIAIPVEKEVAPSLAQLPQ